MSRRVTLSRPSFWKRENTRLTVSSVKPRKLPISARVMRSMKRRAEKPRAENRWREIKQESRNALVGVQQAERGQPAMLVTQRRAHAVIQEARHSRIFGRECFDRFKRDFHHGAEIKRHDGGGCTPASIASMPTMSPGIGKPRICSRPSS